jgi:hypothetical protein
MAQDKAYDVRVVGRRTDDQGRTVVQETFWYKGSFYMTDRYERADESTEKKAVEDAVPTPPNPAEDEPVRATSAAEVLMLPVETKPAGCNLVETVTTPQQATTQKTGAGPDQRWAKGPIDRSSDTDSIFRLYRTIQSVDAKFRFLNRPIVSVRFEFRFFNRPILFLGLKFRFLNRPIM